jgi:hypothetical protein
MSKENSSTDWDKLWFDYNKTLKAWMGDYAALQRSSHEVQSKYAEVMAKAIKLSSSEILDKFTDNWKKAIMETGVKAFKPDDNWLNAFNQAGMEQIKLYGEMMSKFSETWQKMLNK